MDNRGNEYSTVRVSFPAGQVSYQLPGGGFGFFPPTPPELEPDLPLNFLVSADHTDPTSTQVTLIIRYQFQPGLSGGRLVLRDIPIKRTG